jgi:hypothetical protein
VLLNDVPYGNVTRAVPLALLKETAGLSAARKLPAGDNCLSGVLAA